MGSVIKTVGGLLLQLILKVIEIMTSPVRARKKYGDRLKKARLDMEKAFYAEKERQMGKEKKE